jgi:aspartokinase
MRQVAQRVMRTRSLSHDVVVVVSAMGNTDELLAFLDAHGVAGKQLHVAGLGGPGDGTTLIVSRENLHQVERFRGQLADLFGSRGPQRVAQLVDGFGAVSAIGAGINTSYASEPAARLPALEETGIEASGVATSSIRIMWLVPSSRVDEATRALHAALVEAGRPAVP